MELSLRVWPRSASHHFRATDNSFNHIVRTVYLSERGAGGEGGERGEGKFIFNVWDKTFIKRSIKARARARGKKRAGINVGV